MVILADNRPRGVRIVKDSRRGEAALSCPGIAFHPQASTEFGAVRVAHWQNDGGFLAVSKRVVANE